MSAATDNGTTPSHSGEGASSSKSTSDNVDRRERRRRHKAGSPEFKESDSSTTLEELQYSKEITRPKLINKRSSKVNATIEKVDSEMSSNEKVYWSEEDTPRKVYGEQRSARRKLKQIDGKTSNASRGV